MDLCETQFKKTKLVLGQYILTFAPHMAQLNGQSVYWCHLVFNSRLM